MSAPRRARPLAAALLILAGLPAAGCGAKVQRAAAPAATTPPPAATTTTPAPPAPAPQPALRPPLAFQLTRPAQLRLAPGGKVIRTMRTRTEFHSPRILAVAGRKPGWVLVRTTLSKHHVAWLPTAAGKLFSQPRTIVIDLSRRTLSLLHRGKLTNTYKVAIGAPGTPTPTGTFAVTDRLRVDPGTPYGCCILALNGHQDKIAQGWGGGDRIAIHATTDTWTIGKAISHGCVRATNKALRQLMARVRLGTPVTIHR